uniref:CSON013563 protein n=1 Tax=Culicoides sonorensis TaxID=179676 RepID=A0A336MKI3_CULSO
MALSVRVSEATTVWKYLNGLFVIYKPSGLTFHNIRTTILHNLCRDLNELDVRPPSKRVEISRPNELISNYKVDLITDLSDTLKAVGPRYQMRDIRCIPAVHLGRNTSGVLLLGIDRDGTAKAFKIRKNQSVRVFHATGKLGSSTETNFNDSRIVERAKFDHVYAEKITGLVSSIQASHQKMIFDMCGIDIQSQEAYNLAVQGPIRPVKTDIPVIYSVKCLEFKKPYFTLEIFSLNETEDYLARLIHEIGLSLRTHAHCVKLRCVRHGIFTTDDALVRDRWTLQDIMSNMAACSKKLKERPDMLKQISPTLVHNPVETIER